MQTSATPLASDRLGVWAFWLYNIGVVMWIVFNFYPIGWPQLEAVTRTATRYARNLKFYDTTLFWQWMRMPGDVVFALGALLMSWDFAAKLWSRRRAAIRGARGATRAGGGG